MYRLKAVADIGQGARNNNTHRIIKIRRFHLLNDRQIFHPADCAFIRLDFSDNYLFLGESLGFSGLWLRTLGRFFINFLFLSRHFNKNY